MWVTEHRKGWSIALEDMSFPSIDVLKGFNVISINAHPVLIETTPEQCLIEARPQHKPESFTLFVKTPNERHVHIRVVISEEAAVWLSKNCAIKSNLFSEVKS